MRYGEVEKHIISLLEKTVKEVFSDLNLNPPSPHELKADLEIPKDKSHGDLSCNIAMRVCKAASRSPMDIAGLVCDKMKQNLASFHLKDTIGRVEAKPPGFINFFLKPEYFLDDVDSEQDRPSPKLEVLVEAIGYSKRFD